MSARSIAAIIGGLLVILAAPLIAAVTVVAVITPAQGVCSSVIGGGPWQAPLVADYVVTSKFGPRFHPVLHITKVHTGIDLVATGGDKTIIAASAGTVTTASYNSAYGNQVVLDHGNGLQTRYAHMAASPAVSVGQKVQPGTKLGVQGATGYVTGPHLHYEVIRGGSAIDPAPFMKDQGAPLTGRGAGTGTEPDAGVVEAAAPASSGVTASTTDGQKVSFSAGSEQLKNAAVIAKVGGEAGVGSKGVVVALATALQESGLRNLDYGDRDSLGLFQQRPSTGWGTPAQVRTPELAAKAFFGVADHTHNTGLTQIKGWEDMSVTDAAQAVQRSGFPDAYARWEPVARAIADAVGVPAGSCLA